MNALILAALLAILQQSPAPQSSRLGDFPNLERSDELLSLPSLEAGAKATHPDSLVLAMYWQTAAPENFQDIDLAFATDLAAALKMDIVRSHPGRTLIADYRYLRKGQSGRPSSYETKWTKEDRAEVIVRFTDAHRGEVVTWDLCTTSDFGWRVANVRRRGWDMRRSLKLPNRVSC